MDDKETLQKHVEQIARNLEEGFPDDEGMDGESFTALDYLQDALDIEYRCGADGEYRSAKILVAFGGPNISIDTDRQCVIGAWWGTYAEAEYRRDAMGIDDLCRELWECR